MNNPFVMRQDSVNDRMILKGLLLDLFPSEAAKVNVILFAFDEGIVKAIEEANTLDNSLESRYIKKLTSDYGISEDNARMAVEFWFVNYGLVVLKKETNIQTPLAQSDSEDVSKDYIVIKDMKVNEKLPKRMIERHLDMEVQCGITNSIITIRRGKEYTHETEFNAIGEYTGTVNDKVKVSILIMLYNKDNVLIAVGSTYIYGEFIGTKTYTEDIKVPFDETVSRVDYRFFITP